MVTSFLLVESFRKAKYGRDEEIACIIEKKMPFLRSKDDTGTINVPVLNCVVYQLEFTPVNITTRQGEFANSDTKRGKHTYGVHAQVCHIQTTE